MTDATPADSSASGPSPGASGDVTLHKIATGLWDTLGNRIWLVLCLALIAVIGYYYCNAVDTQVLGFTHDDGVYAVAGKALVTGKGFTLLHVVGHPGEVKYPFVYPALLGLVWLINPHFPANLPWLNYFTIALGLVSFWVMYVFFRQCARFPGWLAILTIALAASNFFFMYFFSTIMSEAPYVLFSMLTLWYFCRAESRYKVFPLEEIAVLVLLSAITFETRVTGVALMGAIGSWLLINKQWRNAVIYGIGAFLLGVLPWILWVKTQSPVLTDLNFPLVNAYSNYVHEFAGNTTSGNYLSGLGTDFISLMNRLLEDMIPLIPNFFKIYPKLAPIPGLGDAKVYVTAISTYLLVGYYLLQLISVSRKSCEDGKFHPKVLSVPGLYTFYYVLMITLWNYEDQMARFLVVIIPLLWMYFFKPLLPLLPDLRTRVLPKALKAWAMLVLCVGVALIAVWPTANSYRIVYLSRSQHWVESGKYKWLWGEYEDSFDYIRHHLPPDVPLGVGGDVVYYLYTGHPTFYVFYASLHRAGGQFTPESVPKLMKSLDAYGVKYLVVEPHMQFRTLLAPMNLVAKMLLDQFPERFEHIYTTPKGAISIFRILPPASTAALASPTQ